MTASTTYHHGSLRAAVLDTARTMIAASGPDALSLRALAREIGVTHAAIYNHFPDRRAVLAELATEALLSLAARQRVILARGREPVSTLQRIGIDYLRFALEDPARFRLAFSSEFSTKQDFPALRAAANAAEAPAVEAMQRVAAAGLLPVSEVAARTVALWALVHGCAVLMLDGLLSEGVLSVRGGQVAAVERMLRGAIARSAGA
jgi:AcrR family transcriptional regulator